MADFNALLSEELDDYGIEVNCALVESHVDDHWSSLDLGEDSCCLREPRFSLGVGISPGIDSVVVLSSTSIKINFIYPASNNVALSLANNYSINPALTVFSVTPEAASEPTYVTLTIQEQKQSENYTVTLLRIERA